LLGERHVQKKLLELPIPIFDAEKQAHADLAKQGRAARMKVAEAIRSSEFPDGSSIARQRAFIRSSLKQELGLIDKGVRSLLLRQRRLGSLAFRPTGSFTDRPRKLLRGVTAGWLDLASI